MRKQVVLLLTMVWPTLVGAQREASVALIQEVELLTKAVSAEPSSFSREKALRALRWLHNNAVKWEPRSSEEGSALRSGLGRARAALEGAASIPPDQKSALVAAIAEDLDTKREHCSLSGLAATINTKVRTVRGSAEASSWQVLYLPRLIDLLANTQADVFPRLSSPTIEDLAPGRYVFWARNPASGETSPKLTVKIGSGKETITIDLPVQ